MTSLFTQSHKPLTTTCIYFPSPDNPYNKAPNYRTLLGAGLRPRGTTPLEITSKNKGETKGESQFEACLNTLERSCANINFSNQFGPFPVPPYRSLVHLYATKPSENKILHARSGKFFNEPPLALVLKYVSSYWNISKKMGGDNIEKKILPPPKIDT